MPTKDEIKKFSLMIEELAKETHLTLMDSICHYCSTNEFEIEVAATLISPALKFKIKEEAQELNLIKKTSRLPI